MIASDIQGPPRQNIDTLRISKLVSDAPGTEGPDSPRGEWQGPCPTARVGFRKPKLLVSKIEVDLECRCTVPQSEPDPTKRINSPLRAIRKHCLTCRSNSYWQVRLCSDVNCPLWDFRFGFNPTVAEVQLKETGKDFFDRTNYGEGGKFDPSKLLQEIRKAIAAEKAPVLSVNYEPAGQELVSPTGFPDATGRDPRTDASIARE